MKIFGHPWVESEVFYPINKIEEIDKTPSNSILEIKNFAIELLHYCNKNLLPYVVHVTDIKEAIFANTLHAKYIIVSKDLGKELMPIAQNYLFDAQIVATIVTEDEIAEMAKANIDGVLLNLK
jgi:hypothetical protein